MNCITFSNWINAWSLRRGLTALGYELFAKVSGNLLRGTSKEPVLGDTLFFTEEVSLTKYLGREEFHFLPKRFPLGLLDDKFAFGQYVESIGALPLPQCAGPDCIDNVSFPVLLKARRSWFNNDKLPRGWICRSQDDIQCAMEAVAGLRLAPELFFIQKWLPVAAEGNFSVCGFWDAENPSRNLVCVVQRRMGYGSDISSSSVVVVIPDPADLIEQAARILNGMGFQGPFELEFLQHENRFYVLELNPRFWMQHGLFVAAGNGVIKRYLGLDSEEDHGKGIPEKLIWIDGTWLLRMLATLQIIALSRLAAMVAKEGYIPVFFPAVSDAFRCLIEMAAGKFKSKIHRLSKKLVLTGSSS